jgi:hypothetical protein
MSPKPKLLSTFLSPSGLKRFGSSAAMVTVAVLATLLAVRARAAGIPGADVLTYTGYLEDADGQPLQSTVSIAVELWNDGKAGAGDKVCEAVVETVELQAGRFQVPLTDCDAEVKKNPNLWTEVRVDGASLGRTKLGAVPYAIEAAHATSADEATHAAHVPWSGITELPEPVYTAAQSTTPFQSKSVVFVDVPGLTVTVTTHGRPVLLTAMTNFNPLSGPLGSYGPWGLVTLTRDGVNLGNGNEGMQRVSHNQNDNMPVTMTFVDLPPAGEHTYRVQVRAGESPVEFIVGEGGAKQQLAAVELR